MREITLPINDETISSLNMGDQLTVSGMLFTARDAALGRIFGLVKAGEEPPFEFKGQAVFYAGPAPAKPGKIIGSIGPTTSGRMDSYSPFLIAKGLKVMIGKGDRSREVIEAIITHRGLYLAAIGGAAALMAKCVKSARQIAFYDLQTEAVWELVVERLPVVVAIDSSGKNIFTRPSIPL